MKIFLHEISDQEKTLDFTQEDTWAMDAVRRVDEHFESTPKKQESRTLSAHFSLRKVDEVVVISGKLNTTIELICSRCASPFWFTCQPSISGLYCKDPVMAGVAHLQKGVGPNPEALKPVGQNKGFARHAHNSENDEWVEQGKDLDITYLSHDYIDLGEVITEQLQLQVPFQPLCKETCKGICTDCGTDLNFGRCACAKIKAPTGPFSALRDIKL